MRRYVIYTRVSTKEQKRSGLGLEAQKRDIELFLQNYSDVPYEVIGMFCDQGSGADNGRPQFQKALAMVRKHGAELLVSKLDRLSRKVSFIANLMDDKALKLRVASMPHADKFQLHIYAALAEQERDFISVRTKAALASAKRRGTKLGGMRPGALEAASAVRQANVDATVVKMLPIVQPMRDNGASLQAIADTINGMGIPSPRGGRWAPPLVARLLNRAKEIAA